MSGKIWMFLSGFAAFPALILLFFIGREIRSIWMLSSGLRETEKKRAEAEEEYRRRQAGEERPPNPPGA